MKQYFFFALLAASTQVGHAQSIAAGTVSLGGGIGYSSTTNKSGYTANNVTYSNESTGSQFSFSPSVGYFVVDNLEVGLYTGYSAFRRPYNKSSPAQTFVRAELDPTTTLGVGIFARYYKMFTEQFGVTGTLNGGYQSQKSYEYGGNSNSGTILEFKGSGYNVALTPAVVFFPIPKLGLSASIGSLGYSRLNFDYATSPNNPEPAGFESKSSTFGARFGLDQLQFGGTYYFGR